jgi:pyrroline-5-carboxylate reductase
MYKNVSFVGGGRITRLLLKGLKRKNEIPEKITVYDPDLKTHQSLKDLNIDSLSVQEKNLGNIPADLVFLAVHPPVVKEAMQKLQNTLHPQTILISLVPVIKTFALKQMANGFERIVRMIPNATSIIGEGYNPVYFTDAITLSEKSKLIHLFDQWGQSPEVDEEKLEAYAILTAMGPTYFWFQWLELMRLGKEFGLDDAEITSSLHKMLTASSLLLFKSKYSSEEVLDLIPVRPLQEEEENIQKMINHRLMGLYSKLTKNK